MFTIRNNINYPRVKDISGRLTDENVLYFKIDIYLVIRHTSACFKKMGFNLYVILYFVHFF